MKITLLSFALAAALLGIESENSATMNGTMRGLDVT